ncbi:MAG: zinc ribbon domain-containing protein [Chloroflexi bacterium]|nr:zinc ribbon domain-containing protein [Chloroflexota bacterium]
MPIYTYACDACGDTFEARQSFSDDPLSVCRCGEEGQVRRVIQPTGIIFKGSGFYVTDNKKATNGTNGHKANGSKSGDSAGATDGAKKKESAKETTTVDNAAAD